MNFIKHKGFTLLEVAIVLLIVGLLLSGGVHLLSTSSQVAKYKETQQTMQEIKEALIGLYINKRFLPCPDTDNPPDGFGNYADASGTGSSSPRWSEASGTATNLSCAHPLRGWLPYNDIGIGGRGDAFGEPIKYVVNATAFTSAATHGFCTSYQRGTDTTRIMIQDLSMPPSTAKTIGDWAAFALVSTGKNGRQTNAGMSGAFTQEGGCLSVDVREQENCDADNVLRYGNVMSDGSMVSFDDSVVWVSDMQLISQLRRVGWCAH